MGEVDHVHHAPNERETGREERIYRADQQAAYNDLQEDVGHGTAPLALQFGGPTSPSPYSRSRGRLPALVGQLQLARGPLLGPDGNVLAGLHLRDETGGEDILALVVELDAVVAGDHLARLQVRRLERGLDLGRDRKSVV